MRTSRRLALKRDSLADLTASDLDAVAGGSHTCPYTDGCGHVSLDEPCPTNPVLVCVRTVNPLSCAVSC